MFNINYLLICRFVFKACLAAIIPLYLYGLYYTVCYCFLNLHDILELPSLKDYMHLKLIENDLIAFSFWYMEYEMPSFLNAKASFIILLIAIVYPLNHASLWLLFWPIEAGITVEFVEMR